MALPVYADKQKEGVVEGRETRGLSVTWLSNVKSVKAGQPFELGIKLQHDKGFHSYWRNPGVVGMPTSIKWKLPKGFTVSEIRWPYPKRSKMADYPCFGYERTVLLRVEITPPEYLDGENVELAAELSWMCCAVTCHPGFKKLSLLLPLGNGEIDPQNKIIFDKSSTEHPATSDKFQAHLLSPEKAKLIELRINCPEKVKLEYVFNSDGQTSPDLEHSLTKEKEGTWVFKAKRSTYSPKVAKGFPFVLKTSEGYFFLTAD